MHFIIVFILVLLLSAAASSSETSSVEEKQHENGGAASIDDNGDLIDVAFAANVAREQEEEGEEGRGDGDEESTPIFEGTMPSFSSSYSHSQRHSHQPPSHFFVSAHVQTNLHTGLSYFLPIDKNASIKNSYSIVSSFAHIPFLECGAIGSTTATVPLLSGVLRHLPIMNGASEKKRRIEMEFLEEKGGVSFITTSGDDDEGIVQQDGDSDNEFLHAINDGKELPDEIMFKGNNDKKQDSNGRSSNKRRPSPPTYVVALSPLEITVGGGKGNNQTQQFKAGDVIFFEDTWLGIWDDELRIESEEDGSLSVDEDDGNMMKGYTMRPIADSKQGMNVIMLTIPPALHRQWKLKYQRQQQHQHKQEGELRQQQGSSNDSGTHLLNDNNLRSSHHHTATAAPWWKLSSFINKKQRGDDVLLPKPCSLESDPAFAHPSVSVPTTLSQHFSQHFTKLLRPSHISFSSILSLLSSSSSHNDYDYLILPILTQTAAATIGAGTALAGVLHFLRTVNPSVAVGFGAACIIGFGTWGIVWLGEELLEEWEMWRERRRLERHVSEMVGV
jgi:hypothetical protein